MLYKPRRSRGKLIAQLLGRMMYLGTGTAAIMLGTIMFSPIVFQTGSAAAFSIELEDVAPLRIEWQRRFARGEQPFPGSPSIETLPERLAERGFKLGTPIYVRMFKAESEMEIWLLRGQKYELFETYPICHWSGSLGPKLAEGDKQNPEGFYSVGWRQLRRIGKWPKSINIGFPNRFDRAHGRTGSYILLHGGCSSVGCFAMTNPAMDEIQALAGKAIKKGQKRFQLHIYPFRMTDRNLAIFTKNKWYGFWQNLKQGYDNFERTKVPPRINVCGKRYHVEDAGPDEIVLQKPMHKLRLIKAGQEPRDGATCFAPAKPNQIANPDQIAQSTEARHAAMSAVNGSLRPASATNPGGKF